MIPIHRALKSDRLMKSLTGQSVEKFHELLAVFGPLFGAWANGRRKKRKRAVGAGNTWILEGAAPKLFYLLFYIKCYPTFDVAGFFFDVDKSRTCRWFHDWQPLLEKALGEKVALPARKIRSVREFIEKFPEVEELFIDGTERQTQRSRDNATQKKHYSGKKKKHTKKNMIVSDKSRRILLCSPTVPGSEHDYPILKDWKVMERLPIDKPIFVDLGFQGIRSDFPYHKTVIPTKKPKNGELTEIQKSQNRLVSQARILVEHAIGGVKRLNSLSHTYRNRKVGVADKLFFIGCGLWNFHLS